MEPTVEQPVQASLTAATSPDYIEKALSKAYNSNDLRVESFHSEAITQTGENFCSVIYRLKVSYSKSENAPLEHGSFIVKDLIPIMAELGSNEKLMFEKVLPVMAQILERAPSMGDKKLSANCLFVERSKDKELYLLEDLGALGYGTLNRYTGLSEAEARLCLQKLAQFHAASMVLLDEQPSLVTELQPSSYAKGCDDPIARVIVLGGTQYGADVVDRFVGMPIIAAKMRSQLPVEYEKRISAVVNPNNSIFNVICHGDLWLNNIMINREENKAVVVDFQCCFVASPAVDLQFFFYTSLQLDVLLNQRESLLKYYYQSLCETLAACNYKGTTPSYAQLLEEMQRCLYYGYYAVVCELPICCATKDASKDFTVHTFGNPEEIKAKRIELFNNERVLETLKSTLVYFEEQGILETPFII